MTLFGLIILSGLQHVASSPPTLATEVNNVSLLSHHPERIEPLRTLRPRDILTRALAMGYVFVSESSTLLLIEKSLAQLPEIAITDLLIKRLANQKLPLVLAAHGTEDEGLCRALTMGSPFGGYAEVVAMQPDSKLAIYPQITYTLTSNRGSTSLAVGTLSQAEQDRALTRSLDVKQARQRSADLSANRSSSSPRSSYGLLPITMTFFGSPASLESRMRIERAVWDGYHAFIKREIDRLRASIRAAVTRGSHLPDGSSFTSKELDDDARAQLENTLRGRPDLWKELGAANLADALANSRISISNVDLFVALGMNLDNSQPEPRSRAFATFSIFSLGSPP